MEFSKQEFEEYKKYLYEQDKNQRPLFSKVLGTKLKELRQEKCLSQRQVADDLYLPVSTYANWEQGRTEPSYMDLINLIGYFQIDANEFFELNEITRLLGKL